MGVGDGIGSIGGMEEEREWKDMDWIGRHFLDIINSYFPPPIIFAYSYAFFLCRIPSLRRVYHFHFVHFLASRVFVDAMKGVLAG